MRKVILTSYIFFAFSAVIQAQNVGIGIVIPTEKLHVVGNIKTDTLKTNTVKISTNAGLGKVLVSDAVGNGSWQNSNASSNNNGSVGFGNWGDCSVNNISEYNPVAEPSVEANDFHGASVAISGNIAVVGTPGGRVGTNADQGSASIFEFNGMNWVFKQKIVDGLGALNDRFGSSVAISGNYIIVGSPNDDQGANVDQGSASIFQLVGGTWTLQNRLVDALGATNDNFGDKVSIWGNYAVVSAKNDDVGVNTNQGSVLIYRLTGTNWTLMSKISDLVGQTGDQFGNAVAMADSFLIVGIPGDVISTSVRGSANIYRLIGNSWTFMQKLTDPSGSGAGSFGWSVGITGSAALVGVYGGQVGSNINQGSAFIYNLVSNVWTSSLKLVEPVGVGVTNGFFGTAVAISGNFATVCADGGGTVNYGAATIYTRIGNSWQKVQYFKDPGFQLYDLFGYSVALDGISRRFVIGSPAFGVGMGKANFGKIN